MSETLDLAIDLISRQSVTPEDAGCQPLMMDRLAAIGFHNEPMRFGEVDNFWSRRGKGGPLFCFAGHTDVVPTGPIETWSSAQGKQGKGSVPFSRLSDGLIMGTDPNAAYNAAPVVRTASNLVYRPSRSPCA